MNILHIGGQIGDFEAVTYSAHLNAEIAALGLSEGARVAHLITDPAVAVLVFLTLVDGPFVSVPLNPRAPDEEIVRLLVESGADLLIVDAEAETTPFVALEGMQIFRAPVLGVNPRPVAATPRPTGSPEEISVILYTSGTTGTAKGVALTRRNLDTMATVLVEEFFRLDAFDTVLMTAPPANIYGVALSLSARRAGAALATLSDMRPQVLAETIERQGVTFIAGVPMLARILLHAVGEAPSRFPTLRRMLIAGTKLEAEMAEALESRFGCEVMTGYAMTEAVPVAFTTDFRAVPDGSVGKASRGIEFRVIDEAGQLCDTGATGELLIRGPQVFPGYVDAPELNAATRVGDWFRTGDLVCLDDEGHLFLVDRVKNIIKTAGHTLYPAEIETALRRHPGVAEVALIGLPHASLGAVPAAFLTQTPGTTLQTEEFLRWCKTQLAPEKCPRLVRVLEAFPMTASGKIARAALREQPR